MNKALQTIDTELDRLVAQAFPSRQVARSKRPISVIAAVVRRTGSLTAEPGQGLEFGSGAQSRTVGEASAIRYHRQIMADRGGKGLLCSQGIEVHGRWWQPKGWQKVNVEIRG